MKSLSRKLGAFVVAGMTCAAVFASTPEVSAAAWDHTMHTDDGDPGGLIHFKADGDFVEVCDIEADGHAVTGFVNDGIRTSYSLRAGGNGNCSITSALTAGRDLVEGAFVSFTVCLDEGSFCDTSFWQNLN